MANFTITIRRVITTKVTVDAPTAKAARTQIESYGVSEAAVDMARDDEVTAKIVSVSKSAE